jgi:hypothetical protein
MGDGSQITFTKGEQLTAEKMNRLASSVPSIGSTSRELGPNSNIFFAKILSSGIHSGYERVYPWEEVNYVTNTDYGSGAWIWNTSGSGTWSPTGRYAASGRENYWAFAADGSFHNSGEIVLMTSQALSGEIIYLFISNTDPVLPMDESGSGQYAKVVSRVYTSGLGISGWNSGYIWQYSWTKLTSCV